MGATLNESLPCISCGYELRGLKDEGVCPECGMPIARSLRGDRLANADPRWLQTIARGQRLVAMGLRVAVLCAVAATVSGIAGNFPPPGTPWDSVMMAICYVAFAGVTIGLCIGTVGVFLVTVQEGRDSERESPWSARNMARWGMLGAIAASAIVAVCSYLPVFGNVWAALTRAFMMICALFLTVAGVALLKHLERLVRRVPVDSLAESIDKQWRFIRWAVPAAAMYLLVMPAIARARGGGGGNLTGGALGMLVAPIACVGFVALIGLILTAARLVGIMNQCSSHFRLCCAVSQATLDDREGAREE